MSSNTKTITLDQLDEIYQVQRCLTAITDLMVPSEDLHAVNRDNLALLLGYFAERLQRVTEGAA